MSQLKINSTNYDSCDHDCLVNGLLHAQLLGEAAKKGFNVLIFNETAQQAGKSSIFKQAISILHKKLIDRKVFNVRVTKSSSEGKLTNLYSYCSKKANGAITLMGINFSNMRSKFNVKMSSPIDANAIVLQYLLSASDGHVLLNNDRFTYDVTPSFKFKKMAKQSISLILPPFSVVFWTIKNAKVSECINVEANDEENMPLSASSSDQLLSKLVANEFGGKRSNSLVKESRTKRQINGPGSFLPGLEFEFPFKFPNLFEPQTSASNQKPIRDVFFNKNTDTYKANAADQNPLQPSDNPVLPNGDVYLLINDGKPAVGNAEFEYVADGVEASRTVKKGRRKNNKIIYSTESPDYSMAHDYIDASQKLIKKSSKKSPKQENPKEIGELFEAEQVPASNARDSDQKSFSSNVELTRVVQELPPTYRQSKIAMLAAKNKWDKERILGLLKSAQFEEVDKSQIGDIKNFELLDLTQIADEPTNYEEYDEDEDGFFNDDHQIRTRRSADYFTKNEIPKYGNHFFDEDEESIESLVNDSNFYLQPRIEAHEDSKEALHEIVTSRVSPEAGRPVSIKAVDFFSKSLTDVLNVAHSTFVGWWNVFSPIESEY